MNSQASNDPPQVRFAVLSMPRTGSSMLTEWLSTHPAVRCFPAIFSSTGWYGGRAAGNGGLMSWIRDNMDPKWEDYSRRMTFPGKLLREIEAKSTDKRAVGFKHHLSAQREVTEFVLGLQRRKIILTRDNHLAAYSSQKIVELTGEGAARAQTDRPRAKALVTFVEDEFTAFRTSRTAFYADAEARVSGMKLEIDYVEARTRRGMATVARFLGIAPQGFAPAPTAKRNPDNILSRFQNRDEVIAYLRDHDLEHWANEQ